MFRNLIYFDAKKVTEYRSIIEGKKSVSFKSVKFSNEKSLKGNVSFLSGGYGGSSEIDGEILENHSLDCEEFEELLNGRDDYFDFMTNSYDLYKLNI